jgi:hypothetical protein
MDVLGRFLCVSLAAIALTACSGGAGGDDGAATNVSVTVSPETESVMTGGEVAFAATVTGTADTAVTWSVLGAGCGLVTQGGRYTAPGAPATCEVRVTANADPARSATAIVTVTAEPVGSGTDLHVGPGQAYASIGDVP